MNKIQKINIIKRVMLSPWELMQDKQRLLERTKESNVPQSLSLMAYYTIFVLATISYPFRLIFSRIQELFYKDNFIYELAIVAIAKNESDNIREWVDYHNVAGVSHIYLYDNDSTDNMCQLIDDFVQSGFVDIIHFPGKGVQNKAYEDAVRHFKKDCKYMAVIDCDELIVPLNCGESIVQCVDRLFCKENIAALAVNWQCFGSNGYIKKPLGPMREVYTAASKVTEKPNIHVKSIFKPRYCYPIFINPHNTFVKPGYIQINTCGEKVHGPFNAITEYKSIKINHYFTQSLEQWEKRRSIGMADSQSGACRRMEEFYENDFKDLYDDAACRYYESRKGNNVEY